MAPAIKSKSFNMHWVNYGYFSTLEKAIELLTDYADCNAEEEAEDGIDPYNIFLGYLIVQNPIDCSSVEPNSWLYDHEGTHIDTERFPWEIGKPFRGRPSKYIRFVPGEIIGVIEPDNPRIRIGVVVESPPTPEQFSDYDQRHPFIDMVGEDDCYNVAFSEKSSQMVPPTHLIKFRNSTPTDIEQYFNRVFYNTRSNR